MVPKTYLPSSLCDSSDRSDSSDRCDSSDSRDSSDSSGSSDWKKEKKKNLFSKKKTNFLTIFFLNFSIFVLAKKNSTTQIVMKLKDSSCDETQ